MENEHTKIQIMSIVQSDKIFFFSTQVTLSNLAITPLSSITSMESQMYLLLFIYSVLR